MAQVGGDVGSFDTRFERLTGMYRDAIARGELKPGGPPPALVKATSPIALQLAGRRWFPAWAQLRHRGRSSGKEYVIPVAVLVTPGTFVIGLPWGPQTNWVRNVQATGGCTIRWKDADHHVTNPQLVDASVAAQAANKLQRAIIAKARFPAFLQLQR